ncbi:hypothetical protein LCGC14_2647450, partial [marine sediment metagenome]
YGQAFFRRNIPQDDRVISASRGQQSTVG